MQKENVSGASRDKTIIKQIQLLEQVNEYLSKDLDKDLQRHSTLSNIRKNAVAISELISSLGPSF